MSNKTAIDPEALYWASFNRFELRLKGACVLACSHCGDCQADTEAWEQAVRDQIAADDFKLKPTPELIQAELKEYGAWSAKELEDDKQNFLRIIWLAAGSISDEETPDCSAPAV